MALQEEWEKQGNVLFRWRGSLPILVLFAALGVFAYREYNGLNTLDGMIAAVYPFVCLIVCSIGLFVRIVTVGFTPVGTSGRNEVEQVADVLNTTGIYSVVRHPLYLGNFFMWLGLAMLTESLWFNICFVLFYWLYYERIMYAEEQFIRRKFGSDYLAWSDKAPAFIPRVSQWNSTSLRFSWRKIFRMEKNGFFAMLLIIFFFQWIDEFIESGSFAPRLDFWFYAMLFGAVTYFVLRFLKYNSKLLHEEGR